MKKLLLTTVLVSTVLFSANVLAGEITIVYADLQRALNESEAGIKAKDEIKAEAEEREKELNVQQEELKKLKEEIDKKISVWNDETRMKKQEEFNIKGQEFQQQYMQYGEELNRKKLETEGLIIEELRAVVAEIAEKNGYTYVLELSMGGILYGPAEDDITDELIKLYNKKFKEQG